MKIKLGKLIKGAGKVLDGAVLGGVIQNKKGYTDDSPTGQVDKVRLFGGVLSSIALIVLLYLLATGKISFEEFQQGIEAVK